MNSIKRSVEQYRASIKIQALQNQRPGNPTSPASDVKHIIKLAVMTERMH